MAFQSHGGGENDKVFVNPPYSDPLPWVKRAIEEHKKGKTIALLLKMDCSTEYFRLLKSQNAHILLPNERIKFNGKSPPWSSMIAILEARPKAELEDK